jgi:hypothetical protein
MAQSRPRLDRRGWSSHAGSAFEEGRGMKLPIGLAALAVLAACATPGVDATDGSLDLGKVSPAIYLLDGFVELPPVHTLDQCAEAVREGAKSPDPKALGRFEFNQYAGPQMYLGGCLVRDGAAYFWVSPTELVPLKL